MGPDHLTKRTEVNAGQRPGVTSEDRAEIRLIPPAELEAAYYLHNSGLAEVSLSTN
jgi:hypothetical protein